MGLRSRTLVTGAGGFIGHHLVKRLKAEGHWVRGALRVGLFAAAQRHRTTYLLQVWLQTVVARASE
jgi:nucleoside-diphosphate-sugar epimerase